MRKKMFLFAMVVMALSVSANAGGLVTNGDFQTGDTAGWTRGGNTALWDTAGDLDYFGVMYHNGAVGPGDGVFTQAVGVTLAESGAYRLTFDSVTDTTNVMTNAIEVYLQDVSSGAWTLFGDIQTVTLTNPGVHGDRDSHTVDFEWSGYAGSLGVTVQLYIRTAGGSSTGHALFDNVNLYVPGIQNVAPLDGAVDQAIDATLQWKAPLGTDALADPNTAEFVVYCDPNEVHLNASYFNSHPDIDYFSDQAVTGVLGDLDVQVFDPAGDLAQSTTYYWRVDTRRYDADANDVVTGPVFSFTTVPPDPIITLQPISVTVDDTTEAAVFTVTADAGDVYDWYYSADDTIDPGTDDLLQTTGTLGTPLAGDTLTISSVTEGTGSTPTTASADEGFVYCIVSNNAPGGTAAQSGDALMMTRRLVSKWDFDGDTNDYVSGFDGTITGVAPYSADNASGDVGGKSINIDGTANPWYGIEIPGSEDWFDFQARGLTVNVWVKPDSPYAAGGIMGIIGRNDWRIQDMGEGFSTGPRAVWYGGAVEPGERLDDGQWHMITLSYGAAGTVIFRQDGMILYTGTATLPENDPQIVSIGNTLSAPNNWLNMGYKGLIDEVSIYSYALTDAEVGGLYKDVTGETVMCVNRPDLDIAPVGALDCKVNILDFAAIAAAWLEDGNVYTP